MKIAIYGKNFQDSFIPYIQDLFNTLSLYDWEYTIYEPFHQFLKERLVIKDNLDLYTNHEDLAKDTELLISIGGDGTFLETIHIVKDSHIPILGVNTGRLGFLASTQKDEIKEVLDKINHKKYRLQSRSLIQVNSESNLFDGNNVALNEVTVHKKDSSSMITIHTYIDDLYLNSYWADGLIIATPTGSTAYSLSCGGPIVVPGANDFIITPIAPHNLNVRPVVVPDSRKITLKIEGRSHEFLCSMDSRSETVAFSTELIISKANYNIDVIQSDDQNFLNTIRNKMMWGIDRRN
ncbi:NAD kinase [Putridiphycobacter roseus]|uniref:NAD kinase n=1 Tax=Putridiphycobacter roseus TaxID=2219161 RepID=A0A2W1NDN8_9FLAO|nr:NAD kinase [Putridiphycobacter roseus]PZE16186.1 NAD kinase [Putridiphycobacter roseus]